MKFKSFLLVAGVAFIACLCLPAFAAEEFYMRKDDVYTAKDFQFLTEKVFP